MPANARPQARNWCFTINNPSDETTEAVMSLSPLCHYGVWQPERGANGTIHLQGYLAFKSRIRLATLKKTLPTAHLEIARGTPIQNIAYCTKPETSMGPKVEFGDSEEIPKAGQRSDLDELQTALDAGLTPAQYAKEYFSLFVRYPKVVSAYQQAKIAPRNSRRPVHVTLIIGDGRLGKSTLAEHLATQHGLWFRHSLGQFWDGYGGEPSIIFDDFRGSSLSFGDFKRICDRFAIRVGIKGTSCEMAATHFFITTNFQVEDWWGKEVTGGDLTPIYGRIHKVIYFPEFRKYCVFPTYREYAIAILTPLRDGQIRSLPQVQEVPLQEEGDEEVEEEVLQ